MLILADENIPLARELFGRLGHVRPVRGRELDENFPGIGEADVLAIRSVTDVTPALVDAARNARVIGTATIGTDHIDVDYIREANRRRDRPISVFSAPGSNADSVADYVWLALCRLTAGMEVPFGERSIGIVGCGNCGSRVARRAEGFGMNVVRNDPPREEREEEFRSAPLDEALQADFVTLHVPLTRADESDYPTYHMMRAGQFEAMRSDALFVNSCRGAVVQSAALAEALRAGTVADAVLDVYEGEPEAPEDLIELPALATPHIAGYAVEAKRRGAAVIYRATCEALGVEPGPVDELLSGDFRPPSGEEVTFEPAADPDLAADNAVRALLRHIHDITEVSDRLRATLGREDRGEQFDRLRREYGLGARHELSAYSVGLSRRLEPAVRRGIRRRLAGFGIGIVPDEAHYLVRPR